MKSRLPAASVACIVWRPLLAKVITPSATLPSSSTFTLVSATEAPTTLARAFSAKRPKPPLPGTGCPIQRIALRSDRLSTVTVPSIIRLVRLATEPSKASFSGALTMRAFRPERSPDSIATKSPAEIEPSTRSPRQSNCPVAANEREIDGQASDRSMSPSCSVTWLAASSYLSTPSWILISENDTWFSAPGFIVRAIRSTNGVQLLSPPASLTTRICGRSIMTSAISKRRSNSGSRRRFAVSTSTCSAGSMVPPPFSPTL